MNKIKHNVSIVDLNSAKYLSKNEFKGIVESIERSRRFEKIKMNLPD